MNYIWCDNDEQSEMSEALVQESNVMIQIFGLYYVKL